jgi:hypothetical protein
MSAKRRPGPELRATLCEIEPGLFYATYRTDRSASDLRELPAYQPGTCACDAKQRIGPIVQALGFETIIWEDAIVLPPPRPGRRTAAA